MLRVSAPSLTQRAGSQIVYAVYALGIVASLLLAGHVSDWYGRRVVMLPALAIAVAAAVVFLAWRSLAGLLVARVLTGLALGAAVATATAFITDLDAGPGGVATRRAGIVATTANIGGLACGPPIAGLLARYDVAHDLRLGFSFCRATFGVGAGGRVGARRVNTIRHRAWLAWRSPPGLSRWRVTSPHSPSRLGTGGDWPVIETSVAQNQRF